MVLAFDAITWSIFVFSCAAGDTFSDPFVGLCGQNHPQPQVHLPAVGALVVIAGTIGARRLRSYRVFTVAVLVGGASAALLWVLYGDPAGNFPGLLG